MDSKQATMIFRVEEGLKKAFENMARDLDLTASQLMRQMMRGAISQHRSQTAQRTLPLETPAPKEAQAPAPKKPKKGQKLAAAGNATFRRKEQ